MQNTLQKCPETGLAQISLRDFYNRAANVTLSVDDSKVYLPEHSWTKTFAEGLEKCALSQSCVLEVGVGSGINMAGLILSDARPKEFIGTDIAHDAVEASRILSEQHRLNAVLLQSDLLSGLDDGVLSRVDNIIGCIPQVPRHKCEIETDREMSDYYEETGIKEDAFGLGLVARLLDQYIERAPQATITLNIAGRPGSERIRDLFADRNLAHHIVHERMVRQDAGTSLASLAEIEKETGLDFHFYTDEKAVSEINAFEAETRRKAGAALYHKLYVIQAGL